MAMKSLILLFTLLVICSCSSDSDTPPPTGDSGVVQPIEPDPEPPVEPVPPIEPEPPVEPEPPIDPGNATDGFNTVELDYLELDSSVYDLLIGTLETQFSPDEFTIQREATESHGVDSPDSILADKDIFSSYATYYIEQALFNMKPRVESLSPYYGVPSKLDSHHISGIAQFELCHSTKSSLSATIKSSKVPDSATINELNIFEQKINSLRNEAIFNSSKEAKVELIETWSKFMGCLAYTESLTTADFSSSYKVANEYAPNDYDKPKGVKFYEDPYQDPASRLNIGLYQFTPNGSGNVYPCILQWNDFYPDTDISTKANQDELIRVFGSSFQSMNAFCGVNKIAQTFAIQINTDETKRTHPDNKDGSKLTTPANRCVTPWFYASYAYNHFGPLQNSTGSNLKKLITCVNGE